MTRDIHGLPITTSEQVGVTFDRTVIADLTYRSDTPDN
jgi:hypothetical protein